MMNKEAEKIITRLKNACTYHKFDEPGVLAEYTKYLLKFDYRTMDKAVDDALEEESRNVPPISMLTKYYKKHSSAPRGGITITNDEYCDVCDDKGFIQITRSIEINDNGAMPYQYIAFCPYCSVGRTYAYDGRNIDKNKSEYCIYPITKYYGDDEIAEMRKYNQNLQRRRQLGNRMTLDDIRQLIRQIKSVGYRMPEPKPWEYERGDAWEPPEVGDSECPF